MEDHYLSSEYVYDWLTRLRITHGSKTTKEAHEKLVSAGYVYEPEEAYYYPPQEAKK